MTRRQPDIELQEDLRQERWEWVVQRLAWLLLYALLVAIVFGLLGHGPLSTTQVGNPSQESALEFDRFMTIKSTNELTLTLPPAAGEVKAVLAGEYADKVEIREITPEPEKSVLESEGMAFVFNADSHRPTQVRFVIEPRSMGRLKGWFAVAGEPRLNFSQFVYP